VKSKYRFWEGDVLASFTIALGILALIAMSLTLKSCWMDRPLHSEGSFDLVVNAWATIALIPFCLVAVFYLVTGRRQRVTGLVSRSGLLVGGSSGVFAGFWLLIVLSAEPWTMPPNVRGAMLAPVVVHAVHTIWTLVRWSKEGDSAARRRVLGWIGLGLISAAIALMYGVWRAFLGRILPW
jgi:hypothetical protein